MARQLAEQLAPRQKTRLADVMTAWGEEETALRTLAAGRPLPHHLARAAGLLPEGPYTGKICGF